MPSKELMKRTLYPWTKPQLLYKGQLAYNTPSCEENDGTVEDWWPHETLPYEYDEYLNGIEVPESKDKHSLFRLEITFDVKDYKTGKYTLHVNEMHLGSVSVLSASGTVCARCSDRKVGMVQFFIIDFFPSKEKVKDAFNNNDFILRYEKDTVIDIEGVDAISVKAPELVEAIKYLTGQDSIPAYQK